VGCVEAVWQLGFAVTVLACRNYVDVTQATASRSSMDALQDRVSAEALLGCFRQRAEDGLTQAGVNWYLEESVLGSKSNVLLRVSRVRADGRCSGRVSELFS